MKTSLGYSGQLVLCRGENRVGTHLRTWYQSIHADQLISDFNINFKASTNYEDYAITGFPSAENPLSIFIELLREFVVKVLPYFKWYAIKVR